MTKKSTKKALVLSVLSLVVCITMLVGTTFAWFTDSVTSTNNIIKSGNLDVELYYQNDETSEWTKVDANTNIFKTNTLWEPGHTEVVKLKVANEGTLALKYQLGVNIASETGSVNTLGDDFKLSDYIYFGVVEGEQTYTRAQAVAAVEDSAVKINNGYTKSASIEAEGADQIVTMVVYMPETVGNEANYAKGENIPEIKLGINLAATQYTAEADSFDNLYDENATFIPAWDGSVVDSLSTDENGVYHITNGAELAYLNTLTKSTGEGVGINVVLDADIDLGGLAWTPIGTDSDPFVGTFDGQGHTIYNLNVTSGNNADGGDAGLFGLAQFKETVIKNITINNATVNATERVAGVAGKVLFSTVENCKVVDSRISGTSKVAGIVGDLDSGIVKYCTVSNTTVTASEDRAGGIIGRVRASEGGTPVVANNAVYDTTVAIAKADGVVGEIVGTVLNATVDLSSNKAENVALKGYVAVAGGDDKTANTSALNSAVANSNGTTLIELGAGTYKMPSVSDAKEITIVGTEDTVIDITLGAYMDSSTVSFEGVTIKGSTGMANGNGSDYAALYTPNVTYTKCTFEGPFRIGRDGATFINCTFNNLGNDYVWNMQNDTVFDGCTFNSDGKALLLYADGSYGTDGVANVVVKNCKFNATKKAYAGAIANQECAAIEIHNYGCAINLTTSNNTVGDNLSGEWRIKTYENKPTNTVTVNGTAYTTIAIDGKTMTIDADKNVTVNQ